MGLSHSWRLTRVAWLLAALLSVALLVDAAFWWRVQRLNELVRASAATDRPAQPSPGPAAAAELRFAHAHALATSGADEAALNAYRALQDDSPLGHAARFNAANLLLRQAAALRAGTQPGQAVVLIELAKESLRDVLRRDPQHWDARYNLERAQRLLPDPDDEDDDEPPDAARERERAATTMRGVAPGLP